MCKKHMNTGLSYTAWTNLENQEAAHHLPRYFVSLTSLTSFAASSLCQRGGDSTYASQSTRRMRSLPIRQTQNAKRAAANARLYMQFAVDILRQPVGFCGSWRRDNLLLA